MIPKECKRLAEVDFPIAVVSKHAARENSVRQGHPKTLHLWWARRPLGACRAILLSVLLPDPCDLYCPDEFKKKARSYLKQLARGIGPEDADLRQSLIKFIGDFSSWDRSADRTYLEICRRLVLAAHGEEPPLVVDPFAGGGSIPLEALRIGCEAFASDLNPVAYLISKALLDDIPRSGPGIADELRLAGQEIASRAEKQLAEFYPSDPDGAQPIAYLWARSIRCESTGCGTEIPLVRSFWLCKKAGRKRALRYKLNRPHGGLPWVEFEIFEPRHDLEVPSGTISQAKASCPCCHVVLSPERVRAQLRAQHGGADVIFDAEGKRTGGARLLAVVSLSRNGLDRNYRLPTDRDYEAVWQATKALEIAGRKCLPDGLPLIPDEPVVQEKVSRNSPFRMHLYGCTSFGDLFSSRQKLALSVMQQLIRDTSTAKNARTVLTLATGKMLRHWNAFTKWHRGSETVAGSFALQAISMAWDYPEMNPFSDYAGSIGDSLAHLPEVVDRVQSSVDRVAQVAIADAAQAVLPDASASCWFTDPPYYDAIPYADLSDFFYVWHKRVLLISELSGSSSSYPSPLTPKAQEIVQDDNRQADDGRPKDRLFFEDKIGEAFHQGRRVLLDNGVGCIVFAHKTTEGWEALMQGAIRGGWTITSSWPIATERGARLRARESAALATSVHLVCRPRTSDEIGDWGEVYRELPLRVGDWIERLQSEGVHGADLVFACIGPAMEIYSRYSKVEDAEGREIPLGGDPTASEPYKRGFLAYVWETVGRLALEQVLGTAEANARNGAAGALEEDARLTALFLWTLQSTNGEVAVKAEVEEEDPGDEEEEEDTGKKKKAKGYTLIFDVVRRFAQPLGIHLDQWEGRIIETEKGIVRLLPVSERADQLFGEAGASAVATRIEQEARRHPQMTLEFALPESDAPAGNGRGRGTKGKGTSVKEVSDEALTARRAATTLDRVHAAMLLQASGRANALRALLKAENERGPDFLRLANALSALYPKGSEEKRLLDAMLLAVPR